MARRDFRRADFGVIAAFAFQRHIIPRRAGQRFGMHPGGDHGGIAGDFSLAGGHGAQPARFNSETSGAVAVQLGTLGLRQRDQGGNIGARVRAMPALMHENAKAIAAVEFRFTLAEFIGVQFNPAHAPLPAS